MKKIIMILESGEEIICGASSNIISIYEYLLAIYNKKYVPLSGNKNYTLIKNLYNEELDQFVSYKLVS